MDYGKLNTNHIELNITAFDLKLLLENLRKTLIPKVNLAKVELNFVVDEAIPSKLMGDPIRLGQILTNLINNAIRFTHHGEIRLTVKTTESTELKTKLHFEVSDTGEGIPEEDKEKIFEVYHQSASSSDLGMGGTGLGLAITRKLLDLFGSKIDFTSELGVGTTFFYEIEFDLIQNEMETPKPKAFKNDTVFENRKLLVVEDNKVNTMIIKILLNQKGIEFDLAVNGVEAIKLFENNQYDLIMMDLQMPIMNGYTATNKIREVDARIPIIAMSASAFQEAQEYALQNGFNDYIVKPFLPDDLYEIIEKNFIPLSKNVT